MTFLSYIIIRCKVTLFYRDYKIKHCFSKSFLYFCGMKTQLTSFLFLSFLLAGCGKMSGPVGGKAVGDSLSPVPRGTRLVPATPVRDQGSGELCWAFAMLSTLESEHISRGDSVHLSTAYVTRMLLTERAVECYLAGGEKKISLRGMAPMLVRLIGKYGALPYDSYEEPRGGVNYRVLCRRVEQLCREAAGQQVGLQELRRRMDRLMDEQLGCLPARTVHMLGAEYTPVEFAHSVCRPGEYVSLTSFTHRPFGREFVLEVPDNHDRDAFLNVPIDTLMLRVDQALEHRHPVCWEGDISEDAFRKASAFSHWLVDVPSSQKPATQVLRQHQFERLQTTDDHVMLILGTFRSSDGTRYYVCRNSWGEKWGFDGNICLSEAYLRLKTVAVFMSKDAL